MTDQHTKGDAAGGFATKAQEGAAAALAGARATADEVGARLPGIASAGAEGASQSVRMLQELSDPRLELLVAFSLGVGQVSGWPVRRVLSLWRRCLLRCWSEWQSPRASRAIRAVVRAASTRWARAGHGAAEAQP